MNNHRTTENMAVEISSLLSFCNSCHFCGGSTSVALEDSPELALLSSSRLTLPGPQKNLLLFPNYIINGLSGVNVLDLCFSHGWFCKNNQADAELMQQIMSCSCTATKSEVRKTKHQFCFFCITFIKRPFEKQLIFWFLILIWYQKKNKWYMDLSNLLTKPEMVIDTRFKNTWIPL